MKNLLKKAIAIFAMCSMLLCCTTAYATEATETTIINGYECYQEGDEYYTVIDGSICHVLVPIEESIVTDPNLLEQLNGLLVDDNISTYSFPTPTWPDTREYDISDGSTHIERVNLANGDYYSPNFAVDIPDGFSAANMTIDFLDYLWFDTVYIQTTFYYLNNGTWRGAQYEVAISEAINHHIFTVGTACRSITNICFKMAQEGSQTGVFTYGFKQGA